MKALEFAALVSTMIWVSVVTFSHSIRSRAQFVTLFMRVPEANVTGSAVVVSDFSFPLSYNGRSTSKENLAFRRQQFKYTSKEEEKLSTDVIQSTNVPQCFEITTLSVSLLLYYYTALS